MLGERKCSSNIQHGAENTKADSDASTTELLLLCLYHFRPYRPIHPLQWLRYLRAPSQPTIFLHYLQISSPPDTSATPQAEHTSEQPESNLLGHLERGVLLQDRVVTLNEEVNKEKSPMVGRWLIQQKKAVGDLTRMCHYWGTNGWCGAQG